MEWFLSLLEPALRTSAPIMLAALGGYFTQRAGIFNIGLDGYMLTAAFSSVLAIHLTGSVALGIVAGILGGMLAALVMAVLVLTFDADEIVVGIAVNLLAIGLTAYFLQEITDGSSVLRVDNGLPDLGGSLLASLPVLGRVLGGQSVLVLVGLIAIPLVTIVVHRSALGLSIRSVGEHADAARSAGIDVRRTQYTAFLWSGALCGLGGTQLALGALSLFAIDLTAGRGIIAFGAVIFGGASVVAVAVASLLFGFAEALGNRLQTTNIPTQLVLMLPYLGTILVLLIPRRRLRWWRPRDASVDADESDLTAETEVNREEV